MYSLIDNLDKILNGCIDKDENKNDFKLHTILDFLLYLFSDLTVSILIALFFKPV